MQKLASRILEKQGHKVSVVNNGKEALKFLEKQSVDLVLMDIQMPEMDGYAATAAIRLSILLSFESESPNTSHQFFQIPP